jgi:hypothetical protein
VVELGATHTPTFALEKVAYVTRSRYHTRCNHWHRRDARHDLSTFSPSEVHNTMDADVMAAMGISGFGKQSRKRQLDATRFDKAKREEVCPRLCII